MGSLPGGMEQTGHTAGQFWIVLNEKLQCGRNLTKPLHVYWSTVRAWGRYHSRIFDRRAVHPGRLEGASAEEAVPFPVAARR
jgi:hypothetical protein